MYGKVLSILCCGQNYLTAVICFAFAVIEEIYVYTSDVQEILSYQSALIHDTLPCSDRLCQILQKYFTPHLGAIQFFVVEENYNQLLMVGCYIWSFGF